MRCPIETPESAEILLAYCSGKLGKESLGGLEAHLRTCPACAGFVRRQRAVWDALDGWEAPPVSVDFDRRLYGRLQEGVSWWDLVTRPFRPLMIRRGLPIAAAAGLLVVAGLLSQRPANVPPSRAPVSAVVETASPEQMQRALDDMEMLRELNRLVRADGMESTM